MSLAKRLLLRLPPTERSYRVLAFRKATRKIKKTKTFTKNIKFVEKQKVIRVNDKINGYWAYKFENGDLVLEHKKYIANTSEAEYHKNIIFNPFFI